MEEGRLGENGANGANGGNGGNGGNGTTGRRPPGGASAIGAGLRKAFKCKDTGPVRLSFSFYSCCMDSIV